MIYRSGDGVTIAALEWKNEAPTFTRDDGEPLSDHDPVLVRFELAAT